MTKISLIALGILFAVPFGGIDGLKAGPVLPRENIETFSQDPVKLKKLRDAVAALQARDFDNSTSWFTMAGIHEILPNDPKLNNVPASIQALFHQCHKDPSLFFLWHRAYVAAVERLMQDAIHDSDFRLPYWNWYADPSLPDAFRNEFLDPQHTQKNSLYIADRNTLPADVNRGDPIWNPSILTDYTNPNFSEFQNELRLNEHGDIHGFVGTNTNMGRTSFAARDPIFYLHHANIDRLLMVWIKSNPNTHKVPTNFPAWLPTVYRFPVPPGSTGNVTPPVYTPPIQEMALGFMEAMGYNYDNLDLPSVPAPPVPAAPQNLQATPVAGAEPTAPKIQAFAAVKPMDKALEVGAGGTVELTIQPSQREKIAALADTTPTPKSAAGLMLVFENIQVKEPPPGLASYRVFVNLPKEGAGQEAFRDHFVGTLSLFDLQHAEDHGHAATVKFRFSPSKGAPALKKALKSGGEGASKIRVSLVPVLAPGALAPKNPVLSIGQIRLEGNSP
jgi:tyrosinase-like protein